MSIRLIKNPSAEKSMFETGTTRKGILHQDQSE